MKQNNNEQIAGDWRIAIFYDNEHIRGSPYSAYVYDANLVQVYGLDVGIVGQELKFNVDSGAAGRGDIKVGTPNSCFANDKHKTTKKTASTGYSGK